MKTVNSIKRSISVFLLLFSICANAGWEPEIIGDLTGTAFSTGTPASTTLSC